MHVGKLKGVKPDLSLTGAVEKSGQFGLRKDTIGASGLAFMHLSRGSSQEILVLPKRPPAL